MEDLGQQSLLEREKPRSIIVPRGQAAWWGVDPSTRCVAIGAAIGEEHLRVLQLTFPGLDGAQRLSTIYERSKQLAWQMAQMVGCAPGVVGIEQPSGSSQAVNHELEFAVGCIIAGVYDGVVEAGCAPPVTRLVVGSWWKVRSCGNGAARKTKRVEGRKRPVPLDLEEYAVMQWARLNGYTGSSWDEADALGMAHAMRGEYALVER